MENLNIVPFGNNRFAIFDENTNTIIDDAQGYGYKDKIKARKALWWKYSGGKEKRNKEKNDYNKWLLIDNNKSILKEINKLIEINFKEIARKETTINEIISLIEKEKNIVIPRFILNYLYK